MFLLRIDPNAASTAMTEDELRTIVDVSHEDGVIESDEKEMIYNVFDLGDANAKDIMVPRVHVTFADVNCTYEELIDIFREDKFTRLPIYEDTTDNVIGTINMKDLLLYDYGNTKEFHIRDIMREAYFTYEYKNISELLVEMRQTSFNIAIVLDEYGGMTGIITLHDIIETLLGEMNEVDDEIPPVEIQRIDDNQWYILGSADLEEVQEALNIELPIDEYETFSGYALSQLGRIPDDGTQLEIDLDTMIINVREIKNHRIGQTIVYIKEKEKEENEKS